MKYEVIFFCTGYYFCRLLYPIQDVIFSLIHRTLTYTYNTDLFTDYDVLYTEHWPIYVQYEYLYIKF